MAVWGVVGNGAEEKTDRFTAAWQLLFERAATPFPESLNTHLDHDLAIVTAGKETSLDSDHGVVYHGDVRGRSDRSQDDLMQAVQSRDPEESDDIFDGIFSLIFWKPGKSVTIVSDHTASRGLFYCFHENCLYFSSNPVPLAKLLGKSFSFPGIEFYLNDGASPLFRSLYEDILQVPASYSLNVSLQEPILEPRLSCYINAEAFKPSIPKNKTIEYFDSWFSATMSSVMDRPGPKLIDLSGGLDSRIVVTYADRVTNEPYDLITGLGEQSFAKNVARHLKHVGEHLDQDQIEDQMSIDGAEALKDTFLLASGIRNMANAIESRLRIERIFKPGVIRLTGESGHFLRDFHYIQEYSKMLAGRKTTIDRYVLLRLVHFHFPTLFQKQAFRSVRDIYLENYRDVYRWYPFVDGLDALDQLYLAAVSATRHNNFHNLADSLPNYEVHAPVGFHRCLTLIRQTPRKQRLFANLMREMISRNNSAIGREPTNWGYTARSLSRGGFLLEVPRYLSYYARAIRKKIRGKLRIRRQGFSNATLRREDNPMASMTAEIVQREIQSGLLPPLNQWLNENEIQKACKRWQKENYLVDGQHISLVRIATLNRILKYLQA